MNVHDFTARDIHGTDTSLGAYKGKWLLVVNVASKCGLTPQYSGLEALHRKYQSKGLTVLGFPCNQFAGQEPGTEAEIRQFCATNYDVSFPLFGKVDVNGDTAHPLFKHLRAAQPGSVAPGSPMYEHLQKTNPDSLKSDVVRWNFTKFLVDPQGKVAKRYEPDVPPEQIEADLAPRLAA